MATNSEVNADSSEQRERKLETKITAAAGERKNAKRQKYPCQQRRISALLLLPQRDTRTLFPKLKNPTAAAL